MTETKLIPLRCPGCGAKLEISNDMECFTCAYCGTELMAERKGGTVVLKPLTDAVTKVQVGTDKTAAELALVRLQREYDEIRQQRQDRINIAEPVINHQRNCSGQ
jgi:hypothetical protein